MKQPTFCRALFIGALLVGNVSGVAWANGTEMLGPPTGITLSPGSNFVTAATGMEVEPGTINLNVPAGAIVKQALLYWNCRGTNHDSTITVDGVNVAGDLIGGPSPADLFPSGTQAASFRADITSIPGLGIAPGPNTLTVEDLDCGFRDSGVGALVIFDDGLGSAFSGRATVARVTAAGLVNVRLVDTGPLPSSGGFLDEELLNLNLPGILQSSTARAVTVGAGDQSQSEASVERLNLSLLGLVNLQAGVIESNAQATCNAAGRAGIQGASTLLNLTLNGRPIVISGAPNQTINLNLGLAHVKVVINEQVGSASGAIGDLTVNALHVTVKLLGITLADVVLSSSHADINCTVESPANIQIRDGNDFAFVNFLPPGGVTVAQTFTFPSTTVGRSAKLALFVGDPEAERPDLIEVTVGGASPVRFEDMLRAADGLQFDSLTLPVSIPAGVTTVKVQLFSARGPTSPLLTTPDSLTWTLAALHVPTTQAPRNSFSGRAIGVKASALDPLINLSVGDTGPLPSSGGMLEDTLLNINVPGLLTSDTVKVTTAGAGSQSQSEAVIEDLDLGLLGLVVDATLIKSTATATCNGRNASVNGNSQLVGLLLLGTPVVVTGQPNQTIPLTIGPLSVIVIVNEQISTVSGNTGDITVNALHVIVTLDLGIPIFDDTVADIVVSSAHADISCATGAFEIGSTPSTPPGSPSPPAPTAPPPIPTPPGLAHGLVPDPGDEPAPVCSGRTATVYVQTNGIIRGGPDNAVVYNGRLRGTAGADVMVGTAGIDILVGSAGNDRICGLGGNDTLLGGAGKDKLVGGTGFNECTGGPGRDTFTTCERIVN